MRSIIWMQTKKNRARFQYDKVVHEIERVGNYIIDLMESDTDFEKMAYIGPTLLRLAAHLHVLHDRSTPAGSTTI